MLYCHLKLACSDGELTLRCARSFIQPAILTDLELESRIYRSAPYLFTDAKALAVYSIFQSGLGGGIPRMDF